MNQTTTWDAAFAPHSNHCGARVETPCFTYGTIRSGANHTIKAADLPDSEAFSRPEFNGLDVGRLYPQGRAQRFGVVFKPHVHSSDLKSQRMVFDVPEGLEAMTTTSIRAIKHTTTTTLPKYVTTGRTINPLINRSPHPRPSDPATRQAAIENHLSAALFHIRHSTGSEGIHAAVGRAIAASRALKQLCTAQ